MNAKQKAVLERIERLQDEIAKGREFLETGAHAHWHGFRAMFAVKAKDGTPLPPHPDWVRKEFLPRRERALQEAEKLLEKVESGEPKADWKRDSRRCYEADENR
jgi:hypothetical protein